MKRMPRQKPGRSKQDYQTPEDFLTAVKSILDIEEFGWDLAAGMRNSVAGLRYYDKSLDSLACKWYDRGWSWLNPPFAHIAPWVRKAYESDIHIAMLVPASTGANWWRDWVHEKADVMLLNGRIQFVGKKYPYPKHCALLLYGDNDLPGYHIWPWRKE